METMYKKDLAYKIWIIIYPLMIHYIVLSICSFFFTDSGILATTLAGLITLPIAIILINKDKKRSNVRSVPRKLKPFHVIFVIAAGISACLGLNFLITQIQAFILFNDYGSTAEAIYSSHLMLQFIGVGIIAPIAEELVFRGLVFIRLKSFVRNSSAIFISALIFGIYHGNLSQGIYAFVLGLMLAFLYERHDAILMPVLFHIAANITSITVQQMNLKINGMMLVIGSIVFLSALLLFLYLLNHFPDNDKTRQKRI